MVVILNLFKKSVIETRLYHQILAKFEYTKGRVAATLTLRIYTIPKGRTIYLCKRELLLLIHLCRQCEKPDGGISYRYSPHAFRI